MKSRLPDVGSGNLCGRRSRPIMLNYVVISREIRLSHWHTQHCCSRLSGRACRRLLDPSDRVPHGLHAAYILTTKTETVF